MRSKRLILTAILLSVILLPLTGAALSGRDLRGLFRFPPPLEIPVDYLRFSWAATGAVLLLLALVVAPWLAPMRHWLRTRQTARTLESARGRFPVWGWVSVAWTLAWWILAWTRWRWFEPFQTYTFFPLWLGFILTANALAQRRTGTCLMRRAPKTWLTLFALSALCWWMFEWLNRFVRNWHYLGVQDVGAVGYFVHGTLCFSTVLPAVSAVAECLQSNASWMARTANGPRWPWLDRRIIGMVLGVGGAGALVATGAFPQQFYPALWVAPLAMLLSAQLLIGYGGLATELARGDWSRAATWMVAALVCGFFWELWNWHSLAKWIYTVPGVERWHVFEMPLLGYAGYLPFGLECLLVSEHLISNAHRSTRG